MKINFDKSEIARIGNTKNNMYTNENNIKLTEKFLKVLGIKIPLSGCSEELIALNYNPLLQTINEILAKWSKRKLSLYGKTVIIKSLILPQLIYQLTNLISPPKCFLEMVDNIITDFLWDGKKNKISRKQLYLNYEEGGLKIPNVYVYSQSLKLKWVKFLADESFNSDWKKLFTTKNQPFSDFILQSNICQSDIKKLNIGNRFWVEVLEIWSKLHCKFNEEINCKSEHPQFFLWFNNKVKINRKSIFYRPWYSAGIKYVKDLIDDNENFYNFEEFKQKYDIDVNFLKYHGLIEAVRGIVNFDGAQIDTDPILRKLLTVKSSSQAFYQIILKDLNKFSKRNCLSRWERLFGQQLNWNEIFSSIHTYTNDSKLRNFQYKAIHNILPNNNILYKMGLENSRLCPNCNQNTDSLEHYLWYCDRIQPFWHEIQTWINSTLNTNIEIFPHLAMFGGLFSRNHNENLTINFIILHAKYYIHCCRWTNKTPSIPIWLELLRQREKIEKSVAFQNKSISKHEAKWRNINSIFRQ